MSARLLTHTGDAVALTTAWLARDEELFDALLPCLPEAAEVAEQAATLLRLSVGYLLCGAGQPWRQPDVAEVWHQYENALEIELARRLELTADQLEIVWPWLADAVCHGGPWVPACDVVLHVGVGMELLSLLWQERERDWPRFCVALAASEAH